MEQILFPHDNIRKVQDTFIKDILECLKSKKNLIAHVPTGIGKTAGVLAPLLKYAIENKLAIVFLTPRHSQHKIVIETLKLIKEKHKINLIVADFIGKKNMCLQNNVINMETSEFHNLCNNLVENHTCEFYERFHNDVDSKIFMDNIKKELPLNVDKVINLCSNNKICPYEVTAEIARNANVVILDYLHILDPFIREHILAKIKKELKDLILIFDESHNLDKKARELLSLNLSNYLIESAIKEAKKFSLPIVEKLQKLEKILFDLSNDLKDEKLIKKEEFSNKIDDYATFLNELSFCSNIVLMDKKRSFIHSVETFMINWLGKDEGFVRILNKSYLKNNLIISLSYKCLDPSFITKNLIDNSHLTICMSGTLTPTLMYKDLLGFDNCKLVEYESTFPKENHINLIVPNVTTKFTLRNKFTYSRIANECSNIVNNVPGNSILFFPSYTVMYDVYNDFKLICNKKIFIEEREFNKEEKEKLIDEFKSYSKIGSVLLAVSSASFGEGIDLIGDFLKCVVIVGVPLTKKDIETNELIKYYDKKFGKGEEYGYVYPAIIKTLQNAGRCIRSENDKGIIIFLDERYTFSRYFNCFPKDKNFIITKEPLTYINDFFKN